MVNLNPINNDVAKPQQALGERKLIPRDLRIPKRTDSVEFGAGEPVTNDKAMNIVAERALEKLRAVVSEARAELGLPEDAVIDTSPEATASRIADFALGFFGNYAENNGLADDEAGRRQYADFIGKAVTKGIDEARGILQSLNALNGDITANIDKTAELVNQRLEDFVTNGLS